MSIFFSDYGILNNFYFKNFYLSQPCKCGQYDHKKTNYGKCKLNLKNIQNLDINELNLILQRHYERINNAKNSYREKNKISINDVRAIYKKKTKTDEYQKFHNIAKLCDFKTSDVFGKYVQTDINQPNYGRHIIPERNYICSDCRALMWFDERNKQAGTKATPKFSICCSNGKVKLPQMDKLPDLLLKLLDNSAFMSQIRKYNAAFSFLSFNATTDPNINKGSVYTLRLQGMIHHLIGPLFPKNDITPTCAQIYIHDGNQESLRQNYSPKLNAILIIQLQAMLLDDCANPYVKIFQKASQLLKKNPTLDLKIIILNDKNSDKRIYNKPTSNEVAVLIPAIGENNECTNRQAIVFEKNGDLKFIDANKSSYDPLQYVLMFPTGQQGWEHNSIKLTLSEENHETDNCPDILSEITDEQEDNTALAEQDNISEDYEPNDEFTPSVNDESTLRKG